MRTDVLVIGAGQAGLAAAYHLAHTGTDHLVLDAESGPGGAWGHRWPSLTMAGVNGIRELPASVVPDVDSRVPARRAVPDYFAGYEQQFALNVRRPVTVRGVVEDGTRLVATTDDGEQISARALINATGSWKRPFWPWYPGRDDFAGWQLHTHDYPGADRFAGKRVVVIGGGISAVQLLLEIVPVAAGHRWVTRRPPVWVDREFTSELGRAAVTMVEERVRRGLPPRSVVSVTGLPLTPAIQAAREADVLQRFPMFAAIDPSGVSWPDGSRFDADILFWCASTIGANRAGRVAVREIRGMLGLADRPGRGPGRHSVVE